MQHKWLAGIPLLQAKVREEQPWDHFDARVPRKALLVLHGLQGCKEQMAQFENFSHMANPDMDVLFVDQAWHGERNLFDVAAFMLQNSLESYFWGSLLETCLTFHNLLDSLQLEGYQEFVVLGHDLGGYVAHWLLVNDSRVTGAVIFEGDNVWNPHKLKAQRLEEWVRENSPHVQISQMVHKKLCLVQHASSPNQAKPNQAKPNQGYELLKAAYEKAGHPHLLERIVLHPSSADFNDTNEDEWLTEVQEHTIRFFGAVVEHAAD
jgi:hypothetical protein